MKRRQFIQKSSLITGLVGLSPLYSFSTDLLASKKVRIGIVGGRFGASFQFHEHPNCIVEAVSDLREDRRNNLMKTYGCDKSYTSLDLLLKDSKIDAVFLATPAPDHAKHTLACLKAGKHVMCAVPLGMTIEECQEIKEAVLSTGKNFMMAETSVYMQGTITARKLYEEGRFGEIFSAAAEYNHPGLEDLWRH